MKRTGMEYTKADYAFMRLRAKAGQSSSATAKEMGRSPGALRWIAMREGIRFQSMGREHSRKQKARYR